MDVEWKYAVDIHDDARIYLGDKRRVRRGVSWSLTRSCAQSDGTPFIQAIVSSPEIFDEVEEAKRDVLRKLSMLRCPFDQPIDKVIKWVLEDC